MCKLCADTLSHPGQYLPHPGDSPPLRLCTPPWWVALPFWRVSSRALQSIFPNLAITCMYPALLSIFPALAQGTRCHRCVSPGLSFCNPNLDSSSDLAIAVQEDHITAYRPHRHEISIVIYVATAVTYGAAWYFFHIEDIDNFNNCFHVIYAKGISLSFIFRFVKPIAFFQQVEQRDAWQCLSKRAIESYWIYNTTHIYSMCNVLFRTNGEHCWIL